MHIAYAIMWHTSDSVPFDLCFLCFFSFFFFFFFFFSSSEATPSLLSLVPGCDLYKQSQILTRILYSRHRSHMDNTHTGIHHWATACEVISQCSHFSCARSFCRLSSRWGCAGWRRRCGFTEIKGNNWPVTGSHSAINTGNLLAHFLFDWIEGKLLFNFIWCVLQDFSILA